MSHISKEILRNYIKDHCSGTELFSLKNTGDKDMSLFVILWPNPSPIYSKEV